MGKKTRFTIQMLLAGLFVMLLTVFLMSNEYVISEDDGSTGQDAASGELEDGTHTGTGEGFGGPIEVEVTIEGGEITDVAVLEHSESPDISDPAFEEVPQAIVDNDSANVDVASGATFSSEGIMEAVNNALSGTSSDEIASTTFGDGTHTGTAEGAHGPVDVEVTVTDGEITDVTVINHNETEDIAEPAIEEVTQAIVANNSTDVDVTSGATVTSNAIMAAVDDAVAETDSEASEEAAVTSYEDGTYQGTSEGHNDPIELEVTVENGEISDVTILEHSESEDISDPAIEEVPQAIVENNSTDVDVASGATVTSEAIMAAVDNALEDAN